MRYSYLCTGAYLFSITIVYKNGTFQKHYSASEE